MRAYLFTISEIVTFIYNTHEADDASISIAKWQMPVSLMHLSAIWSLAIIASKSL